MADKNIEIMLKDVRGSFLDIFEPKERTNDDGQVTGYQLGGNFLVRKDDPQVKMLSQAMKDALEAAWPGQGMKIPPERRCVRDGEPLDPDTVETDEGGNAIPGTGVRTPLYEGYEGCFYVSANKPLKSKTKEDAIREVRENNPIQILGTRRNEKGEFPVVRQGSPDAPYSGCYVNVILRIYGYDGKKNGHPNRINASLEAIQFKRRGDAFGAKPVDAQSKFEEQETEDLAGGSSGGKPTAEVDDMLG